MTSSNRAALCIGSETLSAKEMADRLNLTASRTSEPRGENREWRIFLDCDIDEKNGIQDHIGSICDLLESRKQFIELLSKDVTFDIWCTLDSPSEFTGFNLNVELLARVVAIPANLIFSVYSERV